MNQSDEKPRQLPKEDSVRLMREYGIEFEGRIIPEKWGNYATLFHKIRSIGSITPKEFAKMHHSDDQYFLDKTVTAAKLVEGAWICLKTMDSEYGWRQKVESRALERFDSEVICHVCNNRRWKSMFEAKPIDLAQADTLQKRRDDRDFCQCTPLQQSGINASSHSSPMFTRELDVVFKHDGLSANDEKQLKQQRPDKVIGLGVPDSMRHFLQSLKATYCPYKTKNVVYPFLVVEAKQAERNNATFGSVLRQTAFVIRTCLRLQQSLKEETGISHQCIVWSFATIGEEWRLQAAIPNKDNNEHVQIFDLWHGTVLFDEGALQLLLIVDYICDWASEIYRRSIMRCLTGNRLSLYPSMSPSIADNDTRSTPIRAVLLSSRSSLAPEPWHNELAAVDSSPSEDLEFRNLIQISPVILSERRNTYSWQRWVAPDQDLTPWTRAATIRHSNRIELTSLQVAMPENIHLIKTCLDTCFPELSTKAAATKLLNSLQDDNLAVTTAVKVVERQGCQIDESTLEVRALVYFRSGLRTKDWQITRQILCVLCSEKAIQGLAQITGTNPSISRRSSTTDAQCEEFLRAINSLNLIGGSRSAGLALVRPQLFLRTVSRSSLFEWGSFSPHRTDAVIGSTESGGLPGFTGEQFFDIMSKALTTEDVFIPSLLAPYIEKKTYQYTIPGPSDRRGPPAKALQIPNFATQGVIIKKSKDSGSEGAPELCFLVTNEHIQLDDETKLGELLEESYTAKEFYRVSKQVDSYNQGDKALIANWVRVLRSQMPRDTAL